MPTPPLTAMSREALEKLAKQRRIPGATGLTKAQLLQALQPSPKRSAAAPKPIAGAAAKRAKVRKPASPAPAAQPSARRLAPAVTPTKPSKPKKSSPIQLKPAASHGAGTPEAVVAREPQRRDIALGSPAASKGQNTLTATACDSHWIRVTWHLSRDSVDRAQARLGTEWHRAVPVLRVSRVTTSDQAAGTEAFAKDVVIDTHCNTHYLSVPQAGRAFRVQIGYLGKQGTFFSMAKSNVCHLPKPGPSQFSVDSVPAPEGGELLTDKAAGDDDSPVRPLGFSALSHFGPSASQKRLTGEFQFKLATEVVVHGSTRPGSQVTVQGDQVQLRDDGSFTFRIPQPEGRQVLAFTAMDPRGNERRMIVMAVERNTKELERQYFDGGHVDGAED